MAELFIRRPVMTALVMLGILAFGIMAYRLLPVSDLPNVDMPVIMVSAALPGASPETMASSVATPLERQFSTIAGLDSMNSTSSQGITQITLQFSLSRSLTGAAQDVQSAIAAAQGQLPTNMPAPPTYSKVNPAASPILYLALSSPTLPLSVVDNYAETLLSERISMVSGVAQVLVFGSQKYAVRAQVNPNTLASLGIGLDEVAQAIANSNVNLPTGTLNGSQRAFTVEATGQLMDAEAFRSVVVVYRNGAPILLGQLGRVVNSVENDKVASWYNGVPAIVLAIQRQPGTNTVAVVNAIRKLLPAFRAEIPASVSLAVVYDRSQSIRSSVDEVKLTLLIAISLVVVVIFLFLRNASATLIPSFALPMSLIGTFAVMYLLDYSLDNLSLLALILSVGFVVDDAIVVVENIVRHMEKGEAPLEAALAGSREIGFTIISMTLSLTAVFIPVLFMGGILGRLFREFAVTIAAAILISGFISLSLTPMLSSRFLRPPNATRHGVFYRTLERLFDSMLRVYEWTLAATLRRGYLTMAVFAGLLVATGYLLIVVPKGFLPPENTGQIFGFTQGPEDISFDALVRRQKEVAGVVARSPGVAGYFSSAGAAGAIATPNTGRIFVHLKPGVKPQGVIEDLRPKLAAIPGIETFLQIPQVITVNGVLTKSQYQYTLESPSLDDLYRWAPVVEQKMRTLPGLVQVTSDMQNRSLQMVLDIRRLHAAELGITPQQIEDTLYNAYGSRQVSTIYTPTNEYDVILELEPRYQTDPAVLSNLYVRSSAGKLVPLRAVAELNEAAAPLAVNHFGQLPSVTISFDLKPGFSLGEAVSEVSRAGRSVLPASVTTTFQGAARAFEASLSNLGLLLVAAILVMYLVLGILYESFIHPLTILSGEPAAGLGALAMLIIFREELNIYSFIGIIMLIGIVKKNAIMMIDFALDAQRKEGRAPRDAIYEAALIRFRPIMMTSFAALMGAVPIAIGFGTGASVRRPLGLAVVGGLLVSQLLTLYITPVFFLYMEGAKKLGRRIFGRERK